MTTARPSGWWTHMGRGGANRLYDETSKCKHEGCTKKVHSKGYCQTHWYQQKHHGYTVDLIEGGRNKLGVSINDGFSTDRFCPKCKETKDWKQFYLELNMCADCHRATLKDEEAPVEKIDYLSIIIATQQKCARIR